MKKLAKNRLGHVPIMGTAIEQVTFDDCWSTDLISKGQTSIVSSNFSTAFNLSIGLGYETVEE